MPVCRKEKKRSNPKVFLPDWVTTVSLSYEQIEAAKIIDDEGEEALFDGSPVDVGMKETLDRSGTDSFVGPSGETPLSDASGHGAHGDDAARELPT